MTDAELNAAVAEKVMGWTLTRYDSQQLIQVGDWNRKCLCSDSTLMRLEDWNPHSDHNDVAMVRAEIERRGLMREFGDACFEKVSGDSPLAFALINMPPRDQCEAALKTIDEQPPANERRQTKVGGGSREKKW